MRGEEIFELRRIKEKIDHQGAITNKQLYQVNNQLEQLQQSIQEQTQINKQILQQLSGRR